MVMPKRSQTKIFALSLVFVWAILFCNVAKASTLSDDFSSFFGFINTRIIGQIKKDFCHNYILSVSTGEWKAGEFRTNLGREVCTSYSIPSGTDSKITETGVQSINGNLSQAEMPNASSVNNPTPDVYAPGATGADLDANQIFNLTNTERKNNDPTLADLKYNNTLADIASIRVKDMFALQYFAHNSPMGDNASKEAQKNGYSYITIGENIALGNFGGSQGLLTAWMNSPGHRANILNKNYTEIGVSAMRGTYQGQSVWIAAQIFVKPLAGCNEPDTTLSNNVSAYKASAESLMSNIQSIDAQLKTLSSTDTQTYNSKIAERNTLVGLYNNLASEIKTSVAEYNTQVSAFNSCIKLQ